MSVIRLFLVTAVALASLVASPAARDRQAPVPASPRPESPATSQSEVEAQLAKMLEELRRENARRGGKAESVEIPVPAPTPSPPPRTAPPPIPAARVLPRLPAKPLLPTRLPVARLTPPPPRPVGRQPVPPPLAPRLEPTESAAAPRTSRPDPAIAVRPERSSTTPPTAESPAVEARPVSPTPEPPPSPAPVEPIERAVVSGGLPDVDGFTSDEVRAYLGAPHTIQQGASGVTVWHYTTPAGRLPVYFVGDLATASSPPAAKRGAPLPAPPRRVPAVIGACEGIEALIGPKTLVVATPDAPAFIEPRFRQVPLAMLLRGARLEVVRAEGAWYLVRFNDERWGKRNGYVHCSGVTRP